MNIALAIDPAVRAQRYTPMRTFSTWDLRPYEGGSLEMPRRELEASSLAEAVKLATPPMMPAPLAKGGFPAFVILETNEAAREGKARQTLHTYVVKVRREWRSIGPMGSSAMAAVPYAVPIGSLAMDEFKPRRPFDALCDCPGNGRQPGEGRLIEVRS